MVNINRMIEEFKILASFDSETYKELLISKYLYNKLQNLGLSIQMDNAGDLLNPNPNSTGNIYGFLKGNVEGDSILLSAHMDTVSPGVNKKVIVENNLVKSDGNSVLGADDITGIVSILEALEVIKEKKLKHPDIEVIFFVAEEPYCKGSSVFDYSKIKSKFGYVLDLSGKIGTIAISAPSIYQFRVEVIGKAAHAGFEIENGISAIEIAASVISKLTLGRIDSDTTVNIGLISGGTGKNIVPNKVIFEGEIRSLDDVKAIAEINKIKDRLTEEAKKYESNILFEYNEMIKSYKIDSNSNVVNRYQRALDVLNLGKANIITTFGGSDANNFNKYEIECAVISNAMNDIHTTHEYFLIDEFEKSAEICLQLVIVK